MGFSLDRLGEFIENNAKFEVSRGQDQIDLYKENPERIGIAVASGGLSETTQGTRLTNRVFGTDYDPAVNQWGGPTDKHYRDAAAKGIDVRDAGYTHTVIQAIAASYAGGWFGEFFGIDWGNVSKWVAAFLGIFGIGDDDPKDEGTPLRASVARQSPFESNKGNEPGLASPSDNVLPLLALVALAVLFIYMKKGFLK